MADDRGTYELVTGPDTEPVSLAEAKAHMRVEVDDENTLIAGLLRDAREWAERYTRRALITQTRKLWLDRFPTGAEAITLPGGKVQSITSLVYIDTAGDSQTWDAANYTLNSRNADRLALVVPAWGKTWPAAREEPGGAVQITYIAGYGDSAADVPETIRQAILLHAAWHYDNRDADGTSITRALEMKLADLRLYEFA